MSEKNELPNLAVMFNDNEEHTAVVLSRPIAVDEHLYISAKRVLELCDQYEAQDEMDGCDLSVALRCLIGGNKKAS